MAIPAGVEKALIAYFKEPENCNNIPFNRTTNIYHLCGFDVGPTAWRAIAYDINQLQALKDARLCINPATSLDACKSIADIEGVLVPIPAGAVAAKRAAPAAKPKQKGKAAAKNSSKEATKSEKKSLKSKGKSAGTR